MSKFFKYFVRYSEVIEKLLVELYHSANDLTHNLIKNIHIKA